MLRVRHHNDAAQPAKPEDNPPFGSQVIVQAHILDAFARTPVKYNWTFPVKLEKYSKTLSLERDHNIETLFTALKNWSEQAQELTLRSVFHWMDNKTCVIEPLPARYGKWDKNEGATEIILTVTLRET